MTAIMLRLHYSRMTRLLQHFVYGQSRNKNRKKTPCHRENSLKYCKHSYVTQHYRSEDIPSLQCTSLLPSASDPNQISKQTPWKGWKSLSNESSPLTNKENNKEFPPLTNGNIFDSWSVEKP